MTWRSSCFPNSSRGCALPPKMIWTGRSGSPRMRARRSGSRRNSVGRLYATNRPTKPMVSASASKSRVGGRETRRVGATAGELLVAADPGELDEPGARPAPCIPQPLVLGPQQLLPRVWRTRRRLPARAELAVEKLLDLGRYPGLEVNAIRDVPDRHLAQGQPRPKATPLVTSHCPVEPARLRCERPPAAVRAPSGRRSRTGHRAGNGPVS